MWLFKFRVKLKTCRASKLVARSWKYGGNGVSDYRAILRIHHPNAASYYAKIKILYMYFWKIIFTYHTEYDFSTFIIILFSHVYLLTTLHPHTCERSSASLRQPPSHAIIKHRAIPEKNNPGKALFCSGSGSLGAPLDYSPRKYFSRRANTRFAGAGRALTEK